MAQRFADVSYGVPMSYNRSPRRNYYNEPTEKPQRTHRKPTKNPEFFGGMNMTAAEAHWLEDYRLTALYISTRLKKFGWAREKGEIKKDISYWVESMNINTLVPGIVDAVLDSVGC